MNRKEHQVALFINVLSERKQQIFREACNFHLAKEIVAKQVCEGLTKARLSRTLNPSETKKPFFFFVLQIHSAVYDWKQQVIYEGDWNEKHETVAKKAGLGRQDTPYSGDVFCLRAIPHVKIFVFSNPEKIDSRDIRAINKTGYLAMDEYYRWMIFDTTSPEGISHLASPLSPDDA